MQGARKATIFDHAEIDFNPLGHPPSDGKSGGYGTPHFDIHFFVRPFDAAGRRRIRLASAYNVTGGATNATAVAAAAAAATAEFLAPPPAALLPSESDMVLDPESLVPSQVREDARVIACVIACSCAASSRDCLLMLRFATRCALASGAEN